MALTTCVLDAYSTLFDAEAAARNGASADAGCGYAATWVERLRWGPSHILNDLTIIPELAGVA